MADLEPQLRLPRRADRIFAPEFQHVEHLRIAGGRCQPPELLLASCTAGRHDRSTHRGAFFRRHLDALGPPHTLHPGRVADLNAGASTHAQLPQTARLRSARHGGFHPAVHGFVVQRHDAALPGAGGRHARRFAEDTGLRGTNLPDKPRCGRRRYPAARHDMARRVGRGRSGACFAAHRLLLLCRGRDPAAHGARHLVQDTGISARGVRPLQQPLRGGRQTDELRRPHAQRPRRDGAAGPIRATCRRYSSA